MPDFSSQAFLRELDKKLWTAADKPRSNLDAAVYKHAALGLIFLKYVSDSFAERQSEIEAMRRDPENYFYVNPADYRSPAKYEEAIHQELEERDYYIEKNVFWVPALARRKTLQDSARLRAGTEITVKNGKVSKYKITSTGKLIDDALEAVEKENPKLKNVPVASVCDRRTSKSSIGARQPQNLQTTRRRTKLRKTSDYRRWRASIHSAGALNRRPILQLQIDPANLAGLIDLIATIPSCSVAVSALHHLATVTDRRYIAKAVLSQFALAEGKKAA